MLTTFRFAIDRDSDWQLLDVTIIKFCSTQASFVRKRTLNRYNYEVTGGQRLYCAI